MEKKQSCSTRGDFLSLVILGFIYPRFCCRRLFRTRPPTPHPLCAAGSVPVQQRVPESRTWCWDSCHTALSATVNFSQMHPKPGLAALSEAMAGTARLGMCWLGVCVPCPCPMQGAVPRARWLGAVSAQPHATRPQPCALLCSPPACAALSTGPPSKSPPPAQSVTPCGNASGKACWPAAGTVPAELGHGGRASPHPTTQNWGPGMGSPAPSRLHPGGFDWVWGCSITAHLGLGWEGGQGGVRRVFGGAQGTRRLGGAGSSLPNFNFCCPLEGTKEEVQ